MKSDICFAVVCWGSTIKVKDTNILNNLIRKAGFVVGSHLVSLEEAVEQKMLTKVQAIIYNTSHPSVKVGTICGAASGTN